MSYVLLRTDHIHDDITKKNDDDTDGWKRKIKRSECMTSGLNELATLLAIVFTFEAWLQIQIKPLDTISDV